ncbi:MAG TPA: uroporphyrinogen decarboxylase [Thermoanaerobaculia bacterium]|nr:uroporphyrinogen decarboxylase [Thermoanaerobaculia bacterium]
MMETITPRRRFLDAARGLAVDRPPAWMMRQAGRYLPEYRKVRERLSFFGLCEDVEAAVEVSLQPFERFRPDAVILFSDILVPIRAMGAPVEIDDGGPKLGRPVRTAADVEALRGFDPEGETRFVMDILRSLRASVGDSAALLGFSGAPWTLASYLVEGGGSRNFTVIKRMMTREPRALRALLTKLSGMVAAYLAAQLEAGADSVQLFDTWAGELSPAEYREFALPYVRDAIAKLERLGKPVIYFVNGIAGILEAAAETGANVLSIDWRCSLGEVRRRLPGRALQGNLDPALLFGTPESVAARVAEIMAETGGLGHIVNLGHGILPETPIESVSAYYDAVRGKS